MKVSRNFGYVANNKSIVAKLFTQRRVINDFHVCLLNIHHIEKYYKYES
jgi:hypothetical protein